jgi:hypothetical protein
MAKHLDCEGTTLMAVDPFDDEEQDEDLDEEQYFYYQIFTDCTCFHESDEHGWSECNVEGCTCEGGWTE